MLKNTIILGIDSGMRFELAVARYVMSDSNTLNLDAIQDFLNFPGWCNNVDNNTN